MATKKAKSPPLRLGALATTARRGFPKKKGTGRKPKWRRYYLVTLDSLVSENVGIHQGPIAGTSTEVGKKDIPGRGVVDVHILTPTDLEILTNNEKSNSAVFWEKFEVWEERTPDGPLYPYGMNTTEAHNERLKEANAKKDAKVIGSIGRIKAFPA